MSSPAKTSASRRSGERPYAAATALLKEVLPLQDAISTSSAKSRMRTAGREFDARIEGPDWDWIRSHTRFLVNYGARYRKGLPISSSNAESAVNQVVSLRMAKKRQMRWSDEGTHVLALVRVEDLNGELSAHTFGVVTRPRRSAIDRFWAEPMSLAA